MSVTVTKVENGYLVRAGYPTSSPERVTVHESHRSMIREVLMNLGLLDPWEDLKVTVSRRAYDDAMGHHPDTSKEL